MDIRTLAASRGMGGMWGRLQELYAHRELVRNLVVRDVKLRYRNSVLGFLWCLVNPLLLMGVFSIVFTYMLPRVEIAHFPVFLLCALLPWNFASTSIAQAIDSISGNAILLTRVYFPREVLTISVVLANLVNFLLSLLVLFIFIVVAHIPLNWSILYLPIIIIVQLAFVLGISLLLATVNVFYRDTRVIVEVLIQAWFFLTPVFYPVNLLPEWRQLLGVMVPVRRLVYILNPMASIIASYRSVLYGQIDGSPPGAPGLDFFSRTVITAFLCLIVGYLVFCRYSPRFAEEV